jgi:hypothetical protein
MKTMIVAALLAASCATASYAVGAIKPSQAAAQQGSLVIVEGTADVHDDSTRSGIDITLTGSDNSHLNAFIPTQDREQFPDLNSYNGKTVDVTGVVLFDGGKPEIRVLRPNQVKLASP